ncbi:MAG: DUF58 domain-containing protein, partial [Deltaproteobacteria bacterium]
MSEQAPLLPAALLDQLGSLALRPRGAAAGALPGLHPSPRPGASTEFKEHKLYAAGDDPRRLDWRAYAKTDRYMLK